MKKKKREMFKNISNKLAYTLIAILSIILLGIGVYAYGTSTPSTFGHSIGELAPPAGCGANQVLTWNGIAWRCANPTASLPAPIYQCPLRSSDYAKHCANIQLTRNGVSPCLGQLSASTSCYYLDLNCEYSGVWGICTPLGISPAICGQNGCESLLGETCLNCVADCGSCPTPPCSSYGVTTCYTNTKCIWDSICRERVCSDYISPSTCALASAIGLDCYWDDTYGQCYEY